MHGFSQTKCLTRRKPVESPSGSRTDPVSRPTPASFAQPAGLGQVVIAAVSLPAKGSISGGWWAAGWVQESRMKEGRMKEGRMKEGRMKECSSGPAVGRLVDLRWEVCEASHAWHSLAGGQRVVLFPAAPEILSLDPLQASRSSPAHSAEHGELGLTRHGGRVAQSGVHCRCRGSEAEDRAVQGPSLVFARLLQRRGAMCLHRSS
jgi:hypothetical protein